MKFEFKRYEKILILIFVLSIALIIKTSDFIAVADIEILYRFKTGNDLWQTISVGYLMSFLFYMIIEFLPRFRRFMDNKDSIFNSLKKISKQNNDILVTVTKALNLESNQKLKDLENYKNLDDRIMISFDYMISPLDHGPGFKYKDSITFFELVEINYSHVKNEIEILRTFLGTVGAEELLSLLYKIEHAFIYQTMREYKISGQRLENIGFRKNDFGEICCVNKEISMYAIKRFRKYN